MMTRLALAMMLAGLPASDTAPIRLYVYATQPAGGFTDEDSERRTDSAEDLRRALDDEDGIELVDDQARADVVVEVISSTMEATGEQIGRRVRILGGITSTRENEVKDMIVRAVLRVGDYEHELIGRSGSVRWRDAANAVAKQVKDWVKDNADKVIAKRAK